MSFDKEYPKRKDKRKAYRRSKAFDRTCRNRGTCAYCATGRAHNTEKRIAQADAE